MEENNHKKGWRCCVHTVFRPFIEKLFFLAENAAIVLIINQNLSFTNFFFFKP
jgi:hypothetical protein